jgi:peptide/nickel transport system substrate-binding protein
MFSHGYGEMTAEDVKFSFERFLQPGADGKRSAYAADWGALDKVETMGKYIGRIHLKSVSAAVWSTGIADGSGVIVSRRAVEELGEKFATQIVGAGPYYIAEWTPNQRMILKLNPEWKGAAVQFKEIELRPIADAKTAELAYRGDEVHFTRLEPAAVKEMERERSGRVLKQPSIHAAWIGLNVEKKPFDDDRVRRAVRLAIDVDEVLLAAYDGTVERANAILAKSMLGHWKDAPAIKRDVAQAKRLLAEAGHPNGFTTRLTVLNRATFQTAAQVIQAQLADAGIKVNLEVLDGGSFWSMGRGDNGKNLDMFLLRFGGKADPSFITQWFLPEQVGVWNWQRWVNADFKKIFDDGVTTLEGAQRAAHYIKLQQLMEQSNAFIWLTHEASAHATKSWLQPAILPNGDDHQYRYFRTA